MLAAIGRDRERLLHQAIWLIAITVRPAVLLGFRSLHAISVLLRFVEAAGASLAFHLAVRQEAA